VPKLEDLRESCGGWVGEIAAKCRAYGMPVGVVVIVMPLRIRSRSSRPPT
jgi:hypothetical protein